MIPNITPLFVDEMYGVIPRTTILFEMERVG